MKVLHILNELKFSGAEIMYVAAAPVFQKLGCELSVVNTAKDLGESMMIGLPVVSTPVGGLLSFLKDEDSVLFAPAGNPYMMAFQIKRIFEDDNLAVKISRKAHEIALKRHNIDYTSRQYVDIYQQIIENYQNKFK